MSAFVMHNGSVANGPGAIYTFPAGTRYLGVEIAGPFDATVNLEGLIDQKWVPLWATPFSQGGFQVRGATALGTGETLALRLDVGGLSAVRAVLTNYVSGAVTVSAIATIAQDASGSVGSSVNITNASIPVSGSVSLAGTPTVQVGASVLPTGAASEATLAATAATLASLDSKAITVGLKTVANSVSVVLASNAPSLSIFGSVTPKINGNDVTNAAPMPVMNIVGGNPVAAGNPLPVTVSGAVTITDGAGPITVDGTVLADLRVGGAAVSTSNPVPISQTVLPGARLKSDLSLFNEADALAAIFSRAVQVVPAGSGATVDTRGAGRLSIITDGQATATISRVDAAGVTVHTTGSENQFTVTPSTRLVLDLDWPFYRVTSVTGATRVAVV